MAIVYVSHLYSKKSKSGGIWEFVSLKSHCYNGLLDKGDKSNPVYCISLHAQSAVSNAAIFCTAIDKQVHLYLLLKTPMKMTMNTHILRLQWHLIYIFD